MMNNMFLNRLMNKVAFLRNARLCGIPFSTERCKPTVCFFGRENAIIKQFHSVRNDSLGKKTITNPLSAFRRNATNYKLKLSNKIIK